MGIRVPMPTEGAEQRSLARWLDLSGVLWLHPPNGGLRSSVRERANLKKAGVKPGAPDILIFTPPPAVPSYRGRPVSGVALELKRQRGGYTTDQQRFWLEALANLGWMSRVCRGADEAINWLQGELGYRLTAFPLASLTCRTGS